MKGFGVEKRPAVCPHCSSTDYCKHAIACFDVREGSLLFAAAEAEYGKFIKALYLKCESLHQGDENKNRFHSDFYFIWRFFQKQDASVESSMENRNEVEKYEAEIYLRALRDLGCHKSDEINSSGGSNIVSVTAYSNDSERVYSKSIEWLEDNLLFKGGGAGAPSSEGGSFEHWIVLFSNSITLAVQW
tara:strand:+ start:62 stop:625 length:564 start_codon:yes stop_codon:yes gene_type:complete